MTYIRPTAGRTPPLGFMMPAGRPTLSVWTSPAPKGVESPGVALRALFEGAKKSIRFAIFSFTSKDLSSAILGAWLRGVNIEGVADSDQWDNPGSQMQILADAKASGLQGTKDIVRAVDQHALMHMKIAVVDDHAVAWGSYNWTNAAEHSNDEIMTIATGSKELVVFCNDAIDSRIASRH